MTGHTAMHAVPKTARRVLALVAALATLLALFGGLSIAPKPAHAASYTMTFDANGGAFPSGRTRTLTSDSTGTVTAARLASLPTPTHGNASDGRQMKFVGWYTAATGGSRLSTSGPRTLTAPETWYAHYEEEAIKLTLDAGSDGHFPTGATDSDVSNPVNHVFDASGPRTFTVSPNSDGNITAAQIRNIPEAFRKDSSGNVEVAESWNTKADGTGLTLHAQDMHLMANAIYYPVWTRATELDIYSTNSFAQCGGYNPPVTSDIGVTWSGSGVPGIDTSTNSGYRYNDLIHNMFPYCPETSGPGDPVHGSQVTLYGLSGDKIGLSPYMSYLKSIPALNGKYENIHMKDFNNYEIKDEMNPYGGIVVQADGMSQLLYHSGSAPHTYYDSVSLPDLSHDSNSPYKYSLYPEFFAHHGAFHPSGDNWEKYRGGDFGDGDFGDLGIDFDANGLSHLSFTNPTSKIVQLSANHNARFSGIPIDCVGNKYTCRADDGNTPYGGGAYMPTRDYALYILVTEPFNLNDLIPIYSKAPFSQQHFLGWADEEQSQHSTWSNTQLSGVNPSWLMSDSQRSNFDQSEVQWFAWFGYSLTFDANGGEFSHGVTQQHVTSDVHGKFDHTVVDAVSHPTRYGYTFLGWSSHQKDTGTASDVDLPTTDFSPGRNETFYAVWRKNPVATFDAHANNEGTVDGQTSVQLVSDSDDHISQSALEGVPDAVAVNALGQRMDFQGWYTKKDGGSRLNMSDPAGLTIHKDTTFYAHYSQPVFRVRLHPGSGSNVLRLRTRRTSDNASSPVWSQLGGDGSGAVETVGEDIDHPLTSGVDDASNVPDTNSDDLPSGTVGLGGTFGARSELESSGSASWYEAFVGWSTQAPPSGSGYDSYRPTVTLPASSAGTGWYPDSDSTVTDLYAVYTRMRFDLNDQRPTTSRPAWLLPGSDGGFPTARRTGYVFTGWKPKETVYYRLSTDPSSVRDRSVYSTFTCVPDADPDTSSETAIQQGRPTWDHSDPGCGKVDVHRVYGVTFTTGVNNPTGTVTWVAQWTPVKYTVKFLDGWDTASPRTDTSGPRVDPNTSVSSASPGNANTNVSNITVENLPTAVDRMTAGDTYWNYYPYTITGWAEYTQNPGRPERAYSDWNQYVSNVDNHRDTSHAYQKIRNTNWITFPVKFGGSDGAGGDWQILGPGHATLDALPAVRRVSLHALFKAKTVNSLPSAGGTDRSLLLMASLLLLLLIVGAMIMRRRGLVPTAPDHQPLHVAPRARHAA